MRRPIAALALAMLLAGCTIEDVNSAVLIDYERKDNALVVSLKTVGNLVTYAAAPFVVGYAWLMAAAQESANRRGTARNP